jgi:hypothetical protein
MHFYERQSDRQTDRHIQFSSELCRDISSPVQFRTVPWYIQSSPVQPWHIQSSSVQNCTVSAVKTAFPTFLIHLQYPHRVPEHKTQDSFTTSNQQLNECECSCWGPRLSYGALCCLWAATSPSVDSLDSRDWIPIRIGDSLFIISTRPVRSIHLSYPTDSGVVSRSIKRSKPTFIWCLSTKRKLTERHPSGLQKAVYANRLSCHIQRKAYLHSIMNGVIKAKRTGWTGYLACTPSPCLRPWCVLRKRS